MEGYGGKNEVEQATELLEPNGKFQALKTQLNVLAAERSAGFNDGADMTIPCIA